MERVIDNPRADQIIVHRLCCMTQVPPDLCAHYEMHNITQDGHDYHTHEDTADRSITVVSADDFHVVGHAHMSPCGEYWLVSIDEDGADVLGIGWSMHNNDTSPEDVARSIIAAVTL